ncbi:MAG TPA: hypothetical protein VF271_10760 [Rhodanobacteraceae bacterium]
MHCRHTLALTGILLLSACGQSAPAPSSQTADSSSASHAVAAAPIPSGKQRFNSPAQGFYIDYPHAMTPSPHFDSQYLANADWKAYAPLGSQGSPVLRLTLAGSDQVTAGELRIGISRHADEVRQCDQLSGAALPKTLGKTTLNGITFTTWHARDAGMSHYLKVHSYRVVHDGACYAIDLLVTGTNPMVYSPPKTPPFTSQAAFARLQQALQGFHFTH